MASSANQIGVQPGHWKFKDLDKNGIIDENDKTVIGNATPTFYGGLNNNFTYKRFRPEYLPYV